MALSWSSSNVSLRMEKTRSLARELLGALGERVGLDVVAAAAMLFRRAATAVVLLALEVIDLECALLGDDSLGRRVRRPQTPTQLLYDIDAIEEDDEEENDEDGDEEEEQADGDGDDDDDDDDDDEEEEDDDDAEGPVPPLMASPSPSPAASSSTACDLPLRSAGLTLMIA